MTPSQHAKVLEALETLAGVAEHLLMPSDSRIEKANEALSIMRAEGVGWKPIESAPKSGRDMILLLTPSGFPQVAFSNTWWTSGFSVECKPTRWMPIPSPTAEQPVTIEPTEVKHADQA